MFPSRRDRDRLRNFARARFPASSQTGRALRAGVRRLRHWGFLKYPGETDRFNFPQSPPTVSIIVPVYENVGITIHCINAIRTSATQVSYEIIVVDDGSSARHSRRLAKLSGIRLLVLKQNVGYLLACNAAFAQARGDFICLLNNDTLPQPGWLDALYENFADPQVGLVGAKLVKPSGVLQEAGGLIFSDGSTTNYGAGQHPDDPRFAYRREVDYCSAAAVLVRGALINQLGGFDTRFKTAYYEDTDLSMSVRSLGYKVVYEPSAVVTHIEQGSYRKYAKKSPEELTATNREIFLDKWRGELAGHGRHDVELYETAARRHLAQAGTIVIVDAYPRWKHTAGSRRLLEIILGYQALGFGIILVSPPDPREPFYEAQFNRLGVQHRSMHDENLVGYLKLIESELTFFHVARAPNMVWFMQRIAPAFTKTKVVFDTVDLYFLREEREFQLFSGDMPRRAAGALAQSREQELSMIALADVTLVVSAYELELLGELGCGGQVELLSNSHPSPVTQGLEWSEREGLIFVANFHHRPNEDGLTWFLDEIYPLVVESLGPVPLTVVGAPAPKHLERDDTPAVNVVGWVDDLEDTYGQSRVAIAPLRYGAGIKGKVGEAWVHGVPVVMTGIAAEGMRLEGELAEFISDNPREFADAVIKLLTDEALWNRISALSQSRAETHFGSATFGQALSRIVGLL